ncbi:MAG: DUF3467 domain-containing protein [Ignavibacteriae bacterium]|nr:DUF3467 domain-containing protein [Ignavibacteriota bacterium]
MANELKNPQQIQINTTDEMSRGRFSNTMFIAHSPEEFILDWMLMSPNGNHLVSRLIVSPGHMKRIIKALNDNMKNFEEKFGEVKFLEPSEQKFN